MASVAVAANVLELQQGHANKGAETRAVLARPGRGADRFNRATPTKARRRPAPPPWSRPTPRGFNRATPTKARRREESTRHGRRDARFNRATPTKARRQGDMATVKLRLSGFNRATPTKARRHRTGLVQFHRGISFNRATPTKARRPLGLVHSVTPLRRFNRATPTKARRPHNVRGVWGSIRASIGPRQRRRGDRERVQTGRPTRGASIGPRQRRRGDLPFWACMC